MLLHKKKKKNEEKQSINSKKNRFLITVNVLGSCGPFKFVVNEDDKVTVVIDTVLKLYAREGRLPVIGSNVNEFLLYLTNAGSDVLNGNDAIGSIGGRNFVMCKKQSKAQMTEARSEMINRKKLSSWKAWLNKSLSFKVLSH